MNVKIIYGTAWYAVSPRHHWQDSSRILRKKDRTTALVIGAVLNGFRAIDTGEYNNNFTKVMRIHVFA